jgi:hypothetical protein
MPSVLKTESETIEHFFFYNDSFITGLKPNPERLSRKNMQIGSRIIVIMRSLRFIGRCGYDDGMSARHISIIQYITISLYENECCSLSKHASYLRDISS